MSSIAHKYDIQYMFRSKYPENLVPWDDAIAPDIASGRTTGRLRSCGYCGSMHPSDVVAAIQAGAVGSFADMKYGWPHKAYFSKIPNPHVGMLESRMSQSHPQQEDIDSGAMIRVPTGRFSETDGSPTYTWVEKGKPASALTNGKFYSVHLQDATPEEKDIIERHLGVRFTFNGSTVRFDPIKFGEENVQTS